MKLRDARGKRILVDGEKKFKVRIGSQKADDLRSFLFAPTRATRKYNYILADPRVSLVIDNRSNEVADFGKAMAVTVQGRAEEVGERERKRPQEFFLAKHSYLREFVSAPTCALMQVRVEKYVIVHRFQNVMELAVE